MSQVDVLIKLAQADAEARTGVAADSWKVALLEPKVWPHAKFGMPSYGAKIQTTTNGYLLVLACGAERLKYHTSRARVVFAGKDQQFELE